MLETMDFEDSPENLLLLFSRLCSPAQVVELGGLYVVGTSRHESRRVDNQLRGRAGRQGDPGATRFFLSLDDDIFRCHIKDGRDFLQTLENVNPFGTISSIL